VRSLLRRLQLHQEHLVRSLLRRLQLHQEHLVHSLLRQLQLHQERLVHSLLHRRQLQQQHLAHSHLRQRCPGSQLLVLLERSLSHQQCSPLVLRALLQALQASCPFLGGMQRL